MRCISTIPKSFVALSTLVSLSYNKMSIAFSPIQIGLTGSIGMGKSTITNHFRSMGFWVFDADAEVHTMYCKGGEAVPLIGEMFPDVIVDAAIDRSKLAQKVIDPENGSNTLKIIEGIVHPLVAGRRIKFYEEAARNGELIVVYDIPLLFENRKKYEVDYVIVATASEAVQRERVLKRSGMTEQKFVSILSKQVPDAQKRSMADFLVHTDYPGFAEAKSQVSSILETIISANPTKYSAWKQRGRIESSSFATSKLQLRQHFDVVVLDIDDTIVPLMGPIMKASEALISFAKTNMPESADEIKSSLSAGMTRFIEYIY